MEMEWIAAAATLAFIVLVAGVLLALRKLLQRFAQLQKSAEAVQADMHRLSAELGEVLKPAGQTVKSLQQGVDAAQDLFHAVRDIGGTIRGTTSAVERTAAVLSDSAVRHAERLARTRQADQAVQWAELGLTAWQLWQSSRPRNPSNDKAASRENAEWAD